MPHPLIAYYGENLGQFTAAFFCPLLKHCGGYRLRTLDCVAEATVPSDVGHAAKCATYAEQDGIEVPLFEAVVPLDNAGLCINVWPGVFSFAVLGQNARGNFKDHGNNLEQWIVLEAGGVLAEFTL